MSAGDMGFSGIDPDYRCAGAMPDPFAHITNGRDGGAGTHLDNHDRLVLVLSQKAFETHFLCVGTIGKP